MVEQKHPYGDYEFNIALSNTFPDYEIRGPYRFDPTAYCRALRRRVRDGEISWEHANSLWRNYAASVDSIYVDMPKLAPCALSDARVPRPYIDVGATPFLPAAAPWLRASKGVDGPDAAANIKPISDTVDPIAPVVDFRSLAISSNLAQPNQLVPQRPKCRDALCALDIFTSEEQLSDFPRLKALRKAAFKKRNENQAAVMATNKDHWVSDPTGTSGPAVYDPKLRNTGNSSGKDTLGRHTGTFTDWIGFKGKLATRMVDESVFAFMGVFEYDCECPEEVSIEWQHYVGSEWMKDPRGDAGQKWLNDNMAVRDESLQGFKGGTCMIAMIDTPTDLRAGPPGLVSEGPADRPRRPPPAISGKWRVIGRVKWRRDALRKSCEETWELTIVNGVAKKPKHVSTKADGKEVQPMMRNSLR